MLISKIQHFSGYHPNLCLIFGVDWVNEGSKILIKPVFDL
jgi:hypothetical protein